MERSRDSLTRLHSEGRSNTKDGEEKHKGHETSRRGAIPWIADSAYNQQEYSSPKELRKIDMRYTLFKMNPWIAHLVEPTRYRSHVRKLAGTIRQHVNNGMKQIHKYKEIYKMVLTAYVEKSPAVPGTVRIWRPPSTMSMA